MGKRLGMVGLIAALAAATLAPARADVCTEYRLAVAEAKAARGLFAERTPALGTPEHGALSDALFEAGKKRREAQMAVLATVTDLETVEGIEALLGLREVGKNALIVAAGDWRNRVLPIVDLIVKTIDAAFVEVCDRHK